MVGYDLTCCGATVMLVVPTVGVLMIYLRRNNWELLESGNRLVKYFMRLIKW